MNIILMFVKKIKNKIWIKLMNKNKLESNIRRAAHGADKGVLWIELVWMLEEYDRRGYKEDETIKWAKNILKRFK